MERLQELPSAAPPPAPMPPPPPSGLSYRAMGLGIAIGTLLCFSNTFFGLQTGWVTMASLQSALLSFLTIELLGRLDARTAPLTIAEHVLLVTISTASATMPLAAGFVGIIPALRILQARGEGMPSASDLPLQTPGAQLAWSLSVCFLGVFVAVPLRGYISTLSFPSGTATATLIQGLHAARPPAAAAAAPAPLPGQQLQPPSMRLVGLAFAASAALTLCSFLFPALGGLPVFTALGLPGVSAWGWVLTLSLSHVGQGMLMGWHTCASMFAGAVVAWGVLGPAAAAAGWVGAPLSSGARGGRAFNLWVSLSILIAEAATTTALALWGMAWAAAAKHQQERQQSKEGSCTAAAAGATPAEAAPPGAAAEEVLPRWLWASGLAGSCLVAVLALMPLGRVSLAEALLAVLLSLPISVIAVRVLGMTDLNPVSGLGKLTQVVFGALSPLNLVGNVIAGAVAEAGAQQAGDLMQDLKTGHLCAVPLRAQFLGQCLGSAVSAAAAVAAFAVFDAAYGIPSRSLPAPTAAVWVAMAEAMAGHGLQAEVVPFMVLGGLASAAVVLAEAAAAAVTAGDAEGAAAAAAAGAGAGAPGGGEGEEGASQRAEDSAPLRRSTLLRRVAPYLPSPTAFSVGFYVTANWSIPRMCGAAAGALLVQRTRLGENGVVMVATGFVLGEGVTSLVTALLATAGARPLSCSGCAPGLCGNFCA
jgi:OPT family oligopeptide transporter